MTYDTKLAKEDAPKMMRGWGISAQTLSQGAIREDS
jgi:hypothetical protein